MALRQAPPAVLGSTTALAQRARRLCSPPTWKFSREPSESLLEINDVEVHEERGLEAGELEIGEHLGLVNGQQNLHRLELDDDSTVDDKVELVAAVDENSLVWDGELLLALIRNAEQRELVAETVRIGGFEESWPEMTVNFDTSADDFIRTISKTSVLPFFQWKRRVDLNTER